MRLPLIAFFLAVGSGHAEPFGAAGNVDPDIVASPILARPRTMADFRRVDTFPEVESYGVFGYYRLADNKSNRAPDRPETDEQDSRGLVQKRIGFRSNLS